MTALFLTIPHSEMISDIKNASDKNNVEVFFVERKNKSVVSATINIYTTSNDVNYYINENYQICQGNYKSLFSGNTEIKFYDISQISNITKINYFYLLGNQDNQTNFKLDLIEKYAGSIPKAGTILTQSKINIIVIWCLISVLIALISYYQITSSRKEILLKILYGESIISIILRSIILDICAITSLSFIAYLIASMFSYPKFYINISIIMIFIIIIVNSLLYLLLLRLNIKRDFSRAKYNRKVLSMNYILKALTTLLTTCVIACNFVVIYNGFEYYSQKDYFNKYCDYYYVNTGFEVSEDTEENEIKNANYRYNFYQEFCKEHNAISQLYFGELTDDTGIIYMNKDNLSYILANIPTLSVEDFTENKMYYIFPNHIWNDEDFDFHLETSDDWTKWQLEINYNYQYDYNLLNYSDDIKLIAIGGDFSMRSGYLKNPVIVYNNMDESLDDYEITSDIRGVFDKNIMYKLDVKTLDKIWRNNGFNPDKDYYEIYNVYDEYVNHWTSVKRITYINIIISVLMITLEIIIISVIIRLEYSVNEIELIVKKFSGYSLFERHKSLFLISLIITLTSILISILINVFLGFTQNLYLLICGFNQIVLELSVIRFYARHREEESIQKVLKGG